MDLNGVIRIHEGVRFSMYCDKCAGPILRNAVGWHCYCADGGNSPGQITIAVGHNLESRPLTHSIIDAMLEADITITESMMSLRGWFQSLEGARREAILDMAFCMGADGVDRFREMIEFLVEIGRAHV